MIDGQCSIKVIKIMITGANMVVAWGDKWGSNLFFNDYGHVIIYQIVLVNFLSKLGGLCHLSLLWNCQKVVFDLSPRVLLRSWSHVSDNMAMMALVFSHFLPP